MKVYVDDSLYPSPVRPAGWRGGYEPSVVRPVRPFGIDGDYRWICPQMPLQAGSASNRRTRVPSLVGPVVPVPSNLAANAGAKPPTRSSTCCR